MVFVGDRGMVTSDNLDLLRAQGHGYVVGRNRRRSGEVFDYIESATGPWIECPVGITAREKASPPRTRVQEVASKQPGVRVFVVHSEEREAFERRHRVKAMERVRARLEKLAHRVATGRLKAPEKIGAAAARILARNHGHRYYDWRYEDGVFRYFEHAGRSRDLPTFDLVQELRRQPELYPGRAERRSDQPQGDDRGVRSLQQ